jgi:hypothetical protein
MSVPHGVASAIWRIESAKIIAVVARLVRRVDLAEEITQEAFVEALVRWEKGGVPDKPGAWLMTAARHRAQGGKCNARTAVCDVSVEGGAFANLVIRFWNWWPLTPAFVAQVQEKCGVPMTLLHEHF